MRLTPDAPIGRPSFQLSADQIATVLDLTCEAANDARQEVQMGMLEVPITIIVRKAMRRIKKQRGLTNLQVRGEHELEDMAKLDAALLGRIDITLQFLHQFGDEDAYVAVECKRVGAGHSDLNNRYVTDGMTRFATGQYSAGHEWGFMLGYVLALPTDQLLTAIDKRICKDYGNAAKWTASPTNKYALANLTSALTQGAAHTIRLQHVFVDMTAAAAA